MTQITLPAPAQAATQRIAPVWPLTRFVAVNPFLGLADHDLAATAQRLAAVAGARVTQPRADIDAAIDAGEITPEDLTAALAEAGHPMSLGQLMDAVATPEPDPGSVTFQTFADVASAGTGTDYAGFVIDRIGAWAADYFDLGQAAWVDPAQGESAFAHWKAMAAVDYTPDAMGLKGYRAAIAALPGTAEATIAHLTGTLGLPGGCAGAVVSPDADDRFGLGRAGPQPAVGGRTGRGAG